MSAEPVGIVAVVVVYRQPPAETVTVRTLVASAKAAKGVRLRLVIADNTPGGQQPGSLPEGAVYWSQPENPGLAEPYNRAIGMAARERCEWLLTLDQDSDLPLAFVAAMAAEARRWAAEATVAGIVPSIEDGGRRISPFRFRWGFLPWMLPQAEPGLLPADATAINSGALLRVRSLVSIGGYDARFPLNNSDTSLFHRLSKAGGRLVLAPVPVRHQLAILDRETRMTTARYRQLLEDERSFWDLEMGWAGRAERWWRLVGRLAKDVVRREHRDFWGITAREIWLRARSSRRARVCACLSRWEGRSGPGEA